MRDPLQRRSRRITPVLLWGTLLVLIAGIAGFFVLRYRQQTARQEAATHVKEEPQTITQTPVKFTKVAPYLPEPVPALLNGDSSESINPMGPHVGSRSAGSALPMTASVPVRRRGRAPTQYAPMGFLHASSVPPADPRYTLAAGTKIPITLEVLINSEIPGTVLFTTRRHVLDSATRRYPVVTGGLTVVAEAQTGHLLLGNERVPVVGKTLTLADGTSIDLQDAPITDAAGTNGLTGEVNNHVWRLIWTSVFIGGLRGGQRVIQQQVANEGAGFVAEGISAETSQAAQQRIGRSQDTRPTITVQAGELAFIIVVKPLTIAPPVARR